MIYHSYSPDETAKIAGDFAKTLKKGDCICMFGNLGVGKTAFVKGLAKGIGVTDILSSPTFTIVNCYEGALPLYHFDVYRIQDEEEMYEIGYEEYVYGDGISVIEWSENIKEILPKNRYEITLEKDYEKGDDYRMITIERIDR